MPRLEKRARLSREEWLKEALEVLNTQGSAKLHIAELSRALGVSKGSFYWHFKDRTDFTQAIVEYWDRTFTRNVKQAAIAAGGPPEERLLFVLRRVMEEDLTAYDAIFDAWAAHQPEIRPGVTRVHRFRHRYIKSLFAELGFEAEDLVLRTQLFMGLLKYREGKMLGFQTKEYAGDLAHQLAFLIRKP